MVRKTPKGPEFDEAQLGFAADTMASAFAAYGYACAFTGQDLRAEAMSDPRGYLLNLAGNPLVAELNLFIPATLDAIFAFERGHLAIGVRYNFLVDLERINPEFLERLNPIGRLRLPADPAAMPSRGALAASVIALAAGRHQADD